MSINLQTWYEQMQVGNVILAYKGSISSDLISNSLNQIEEKLDSDNESLKVKRRIYNVLVEVLQNLYHHLEIPPGFNDGSQNTDKYGLFVFSKLNNTTFKISTGNFVKTKDYQMLKDRLDQINYLTQDELKDLYKLVLNNDEFSSKGGGGLGFIDIARKTGNKYEYKFVDYDNKYYFFCLDITVN